MVASQPAVEESGSVVRSVDRALDLLEALMKTTRPVSLAELSEMVHLHPSTVFRLLGTMSRRLFVYHDPDTKLYMLGPKLSSTLRGQGLVENFTSLALPVLRDLAASVGEAASLAVRSGDKAMYIAQASGGRSINMFVQIGALVPMYCTGVGKVILAYLQPDEVPQILGGDRLAAVTDRTITDRRRLDEELEAIRRRGYAVDDEEREIGIRCIAAPVFYSPGKLAGAISVSGPAGRIAPHLDASLARSVQESAARISEKLGFPPQSAPLKSGLEAGRG